MSTKIEHYTDGPATIIHEMNSTSSGEHGLQIASNQGVGSNAKITNEGKASKQYRQVAWIVFVFAIGICIGNLGKYLQETDKASSLGVLSAQITSQVYASPMPKAAVQAEISMSTSASTQALMAQHDDCTAPEQFQTAIHHGIPQPFVDRNHIAHGLNGVNVRSIINADGRPRYSQKQMNEISAKGFDSLRVLLNWPDFEPTKGRFNEAAFEGLDTAIEQAANAGLWVILTPIHVKGGEELHKWGIPTWAWNGDPNGSRMLDVLATHALPYLRQITARYCANPTVIGIDLVNEPREPQNGHLRHRNQLLVEMYMEWIVDLRTIDPNKILVLEPFYGSTRIDINGNALEPLADMANVVWSIHDHYAGEGSPSSGYSHSGYPNIQPRTDQWDSVSIYPQSDRATARADVAEHLRYHQNAAAEVGLPLYIGEYGVPKGWEGGWELLCDKTTIYAQLDLAAAAWVWNQDVDGGFGLWHPHRGWTERTDALFDSECR